MDYRHIRVEDHGEALVVYCMSDDLVTDMAVEGVARELYDACAVAIAKTKRAMILDLGGVRSMSSSFLGKVITLNKRSSVGGVTLRIENMPPALAELFRQTNIVTTSSSDRAANRETPPRLARELFGARLDVLDRLKKEGFLWTSDFQSVEPRHDVYGIDVCGITTEDDARAILNLLIVMFPSWRSRRTVVEEGCDSGWRVEVHRGYGPAAHDPDG